MIDYYYHPCDVGTFRRMTPIRASAWRGAPECGDLMELRIRDQTGGEVIEEEAEFKTIGCGSANCRALRSAPNWSKARP